MLCERLLSVKCLPSDGSRCILHFGAVDQYAKVLVNGKVVVSHIGGYLPFSADITDALQVGCNTLTVHIEDRSDTSYHSVGKHRPEWNLADSMDGMGSGCLCQKTGTHPFI